MLNHDSVIIRDYKGSNHNWYGSLSYNVFCIFTFDFDHLSLGIRVFWIIHRGIYATTFIPCLTLWNKWVWIQEVRQQQSHKAFSYGDQRSNLWCFTEHVIMMYFSFHLFKFLFYVMIFLIIWTVFILYYIRCHVIFTYIIINKNMLLIVKFDILLKLMLH